MPESAWLPGVSSSPLRWSHFPKSKICGHVLYHDLSLLFFIIINHHYSSLFIIVHHYSSFIIIHHYSSCIHFSWCFEILGLKWDIEILQDFSKSSATQAANNLAGTLSQVVGRWKTQQKPPRINGLVYSNTTKKRCRKVCFLDVIHFSLFFIFWGHFVVYDNGI